MSTEHGANTEAYVSSTVLSGHVSPRLYVVCQPRPPNLYVMFIALNANWDKDTLMGARFRSLIFWNTRRFFSTLAKDSRCLRVIVMSSAQAVTVQS